MRELHLHGKLAEIGGPFELEVETPAEAIRCLSTQLPRFNEILDEGSWTVTHGVDPIVDENDLHLGLGQKKQIHIYPKIQGAGDDGVGKALAGAALIGASFFVPAAGVAGLSMLTAGTVASMGVSLTLNGISTALSSRDTPNYEDRSKVEEKPSYLFDGPINNASQGLAVPIILGRIRTGSIVISSGLSAEKL